MSPHPPPKPPQLSPSPSPHRTFLTGRSLSHPSLTVIPPPKSRHHVHPAAGTLHYPSRLYGTTSHPFFVRIPSQATLSPAIPGTGIPGTAQLRSQHTPLPLLFSIPSPSPDLFPRTIGNQPIRLARPHTTSPQSVLEANMLTKSPPCIDAPF